MEEKEVVPKPEETTPVPEVTPPTVQEDPAPKDDTRAIVEDLVTRFDALSETVKGIVEAGGEIQQDTSPVKKPWTHRPFFGRG